MLDVRLAGLLKFEKKFPFKLIRINYSTIVLNFSYVKSLVFSEYFNKITVPSALNRLEPSTDFWRNLDMSSLIS